ncbi:hypothetical protein [Botrimarina mediterranea]|uniref:Uncharacterized protein n=1 Tax=Botrimarina mediterranea TaxID=2528022 RepID=A0A518K5Y7_9BACT|nr:hypothetical protein [Botrimarina mediterranea]QDV73201.1 hypothetical protein Spa11_13970 [Botrimarina mediterranea]
MVVGIFLFAFQRKPADMTASIHCGWCTHFCSLAAAAVLCLGVPHESAGEPAAAQRLPAYDPLPFGLPATTSVSAENLKGFYIPCFENRVVGHISFRLDSFKENLMRIAVFDRSDVEGFDLLVTHGNKNFPSPIKIPYGWRCSVHKVGESFFADAYTWEGDKQSHYLFRLLSSNKVPFKNLLLVPLSKQSRSDYGSIAGADDLLKYAAANQGQSSLATEGQIWFAESNAAALSFFGNTVTDGKAAYDQLERRFPDPHRLARLRRLHPGQVNPVTRDIVGYRNPNRGERSDIDPVVVYFGAIVAAAIAAPAIEALLSDGQQQPAAVTPPSYEPKTCPHCFMGRRFYDQALCPYCGGTGRQ